MATIPKKPPSRLTKQQFLARRPGGVYQNYLNAYRRQHPALDKPRPVTYGGLLAGLQQSLETPAQIEARANRMAQMQYKTSAADVRAEAARMRKEAQDRAAAMAAAGRAAAAQNAQLFGLVGGEYNAAAQEMRGLGTNLSGAMAAQTNADVAAANASLANVGAPALTVGGPVGAPGIAGDTQAGVEAYRGGELPAQALANAGEAAQFGLAGMVSAQNLRATQEAQAAFQQSVRDADSARLAALKELQRGRPQMASQYLMQLQDAQRQQISLAMSLLSARTGMQQSEAELGMARGQQQFTQRQTRKEFNESVRQFKAKMTEDRRQFNKSLTASKATAKKGAKGETARDLIASVVADLGSNAFDPDFQAGLASVYYSSPTPAQGQPQGKDARQRENAVVNYLMNVYWPQVEASTPKANRVARSQELLAKIQAWFRRAPLPDFNTYRLQALKGG